MRCSIPLIAFLGKAKAKVMYPHKVLSQLIFDMYGCFTLKQDHVFFVFCKAPLERDTADIFSGMVKNMNIGGVF